MAADEGCNKDIKLTDLRDEDIDWLYGELERKIQTRRWAVELAYKSIREGRDHIIIDPDRVLQIADKFDAFVRNRDPLRHPE